MKKTHYLLIAIMTLTAFFSCEDMMQDGIPTPTGESLAGTWEIEKVTQVSPSNKREDFTPTGGDKEYMEIAKGRKAFVKFTLTEDKITTNSITGNFALHGWRMTLDKKITVNYADIEVEMGYIQLPSDDPNILVISFSKAGEPTNDLRLKRVNFKYGDFESD